MTLSRCFPKPSKLFSFLRRIRSHVYWGLMGAVHQVVGTRLYEKKWASRAMESDQVISNVEHPHRHWLLNQFDALVPFSSVLEFGCGYGANVQLLARRFSDVEVVGLDINPIAIREGNARLAQLGIERARLILGKGDDLSQFGDRSIDVVFTDATLLYIGPDQIRTVISEMKRISRRALLFIELHGCPDSHSDAQGLGVHTPDGWVRDYRTLLNHFFDNNSIMLTKIPVDIWQTGRWPVWGYLVEVTL